MPSIIKNRLITLGIGFIAILIVFSAYGLINYIINKPEVIDFNPNINKEAIEAIKKEEITDLEKFSKMNQLDIYPNGLVTPITLITACEDKNININSCNNEIANITKIFYTEKIIESGYLYIKAGVSRNSNQLQELTKYDSIWFYLDNNKFGGHLLRSKALINRQSEEGVTELLYSLNEIPFTKIPYDDQDKNPRITNLIDQINNGKQHIIGAFISTKSYGKILEMKVGYLGGELKMSSK